jgi:cytochrome oxidase Cu insertion factor (SCO1/SenC/PrrC family)
VEKETPAQIPASSHRWPLIAVGSLAVALLAAGLVGLAVMSKRERPTPAPNFVLRDQDGQLTSLAQFRGKVVALTFIDPECTQVCPLTTQSMVEALKMLGPAASQVQLIGIDANPEKTQVADVAAYTNAHGLQGRMRFLTGSPAELESVWRSYGVYVAVVNDDIEHDTSIVLIDGAGKRRGASFTAMSYQGMGEQARMLAEDIARLLPGHPGVSAGQASQQEPLKPTETVSLTPLGSRREPVSLGGSQPHLTVFFARWLAPDAELSRDLAALDGYAELARRKGWPSPVAVEELTIEPSAAEARQALTSVSTTVRTPIVEDASGRLADGYHVEDLPWYVLNSASGRILWHHNGWLSAAELDRQVRTALAGKGESESDIAQVGSK